MDGASSIAARMEAAPDEATKSKLQSAIEGISGLGREVAVQVTAERVKRMAIGYRPWTRSRS